MLPSLLSLLFRVLGLNITMITRLFENDNKIEKTWSLYGMTMLKRVLDNDTRYFSIRDVTILREYFEQGIENNEGLKEVFINLMNMFIGADPTPVEQNIYVPWMANAYNKGNISSLNELMKITRVLSDYHEMKTKRVFQNSSNDEIKKASDINRFKTIHQLSDTINKISRGDGKYSISDRNFIDKLKGYISNRSVIVKQINNEHTVGIIELNDYDANATLFKQRTSWCTTTSYSDYKDYSPLVAYFDLANDFYEQVSLNTFAHYDQDDLEIDTLEGIKASKLYDYISNIVTANPWEYANQSRVSEFIAYVNDPSGALQKLAASYGPNALLLIDDPSDDVIISSVRNGYRVLGYHVKDPSDDVIVTIAKYSIKEFGDIAKNIDESLYDRLIDANPLVIQYFDNLTDAQKLTAVRKDFEAIKYVDNPSDEMIKSAMRQSHYAIQYIDNPSEKLQKYVIRKQNGSLSLIKSPSNAMIKYAKELSQQHEKK